MTAETGCGDSCRAAVQCFSGIVARPSVEQSYTVSTMLFRLRAVPPKSEATSANNIEWEQVVRIKVELVEWLRHRVFSYASWRRNERKPRRQTRCRCSADDPKYGLALPACVISSRYMRGHGHEGLRASSGKRIRALRGAPSCGDQKRTDCCRPQGRPPVSSNMRIERASL